MKLRWLTLLLVVLGIPSLTFLTVVGAERFLACEMNPYAGFTCPAVLAYLLPLATIGVLTVVPCAIILGIWIPLSYVIWRGKGR
jgi:hypothetical protein